MTLPRKEAQMETVRACSMSEREKSISLSFTPMLLLGQGAFGVVSQAKLHHNGEIVAIKITKQEKHLKNRELTFMRELNHCNVIRLLYYFFRPGKSKGENSYLSLVMEFMPTTVCRYVGKMKSFKRIIPPILIKVMMYQLFRSLAYIHEQTICHRDVKPENILFNPESGVLKLGDLGSAKKLVKGEHNVSYICSRYCRPPELLFGCSDYTTKVDIWSAGCVFAQILIGRPLFAASTNVDQLVEVIKVLGTPSKKHIEELNRKYLKFDFPNIDPVPLHSAFGPGTPEDAIHLLSQLLDFSPSARLHPMVACSHQFFDKLREKGTKLANGSELPPLFNFTSSEKKIQERLKIQLDPALYV